MLKAHRIRLHPTPQQRAALLRAAGVARFAYNWALAEYQRLKAAREPVDWNGIKKRFRATIDPEFPFVRAVTKCAAEEGIADCRRAIATYYKARATNPRLCFPGLLALLAGNGYLGVTPVEPSASAAGFGLWQAGAVKQERTGAHWCTPER